MVCFFASDLHGRPERYAALFAAIAAEPPAAVFLGGDLLPPAFGGNQAAFVEEVLAPGFRRVRQTLASAAPRVFLILGNDDCRSEEAALAAPPDPVWEYSHGRRIELGSHCVYGYACVPPSPFRLKDWERYDVSRYVDPGCLPPEEGWHTTEPTEDLRRVTIAQDLERLAGNDDLSRAIFLLHSPPYRTALDRAALDGKQVDHAPLDVHVGSIAIRSFIEARQPLLTLHGHVHESTRLTGCWRDRIGRTHCLSAAHDGPELALVRFDPGDLAAATRELL